MTYFIIYSFLSFNVIFIFNSFNVYHINQAFSNFSNKIIIKFLLIIPLLSLGGLPPFLGFLPKWLVIQTITHSNFLFIITIIVCLTLLTLFYYLQICYSAIILNNWEIKWNFSINHLNLNIKICLLLCFFSIFGLILTNLVLII